MRRPATVPISSRNSASTPWNGVTKNGSTFSMPALPHNAPTMSAPTSRKMLRPNSASCIAALSEVKSGLPLWLVASLPSTTPTRMAGDSITARNAVA